MPFRFSLMNIPSGPGPLWFKPQRLAQLREPFASRLATLERFRAAGGRYVISNRPARRFTLPQAGRSHIKTAIVNDKIYIGGHNLSLANETDLMTCWHDEHAAEWVYNLVRGIITTGSTHAEFNGQDRRLSLGANAALLIDAGTPGQSLILDEALRFIDHAQDRILLTCQFFPGGRTAQHLLAAYRRSVRVEILYSPTHVHGKHMLAHQLQVLRERTRLPRLFFTGQLRHSA
jgi:hypothetical protein